MTESTEVSTLEGILRENGLITSDVNGEYFINNKEKAWDVYIGYVNNTGLINKYLIKGYKFLKDKNVAKPADWLLQVYFGGNMTQKDQEAFSLIADVEPYKLTVQNSLVTMALSAQYYAMVKGGGLVADLVANINPDNVDQVGYGFAFGIAGANLVRLGVAVKTKKSYAGICIDSLLFNSTTYLKKLKNKIN